MESSEIIHLLLNPHQVTIGTTVAEVVTGPNHGKVLVVAGHQTVVDRSIGLVVENHHQMPNIGRVVVMVVALGQDPGAGHYGSIVPECETVLDLQLVGILQCKVQFVVEGRTISVPLGGCFVAPDFVPIAGVTAQIKVLDHSHSPTLTVEDDGGRGIDQNGREEEKGYRSHCLNEPSWTMQGQSVGFVFILAGTDKGSSYLSSGP